MKKWWDLDSMNKWIRDFKGERKIYGISLPAKLIQMKTKLTMYSSQRTRKSISN